MKNHRDKLIVSTVIILFSVFFAGKATAQRLVFLFGHGVYSVPAGTNFKNAYRFGLGGEVGVGVGLLGKTFITGAVGYTDFVHSSSSEMGNLQYTPVKVGIRHYLLARVLFVHGDLGPGFFKQNKVDNKFTKFTGDIGVGVKLAGLEVSADYDGILGSNPSGSWFALKAGFNFGL